MKLPILLLILSINAGMVMAQSPCKLSGVSGQLQVGDIKCRYYECKPSTGKGDRGLGICSCKNVKKNKKVPNSSCIYYPNNPHNCGNNYNGNHQEYYKALAKSAMENGAPCSKPQISEKLCNLVYPCYSGSCPKNRKRRDVDSSDTCPAWVMNLSSNKADTPALQILPVSVVMLAFIVLK